MASRTGNLTVHSPRGQNHGSSKERGGQLAGHHGSPEGAHDGCGRCSSANRKRGHGARHGSTHLRDSTLLPPLAWLALLLLVWPADREPGRPFRDRGVHDSLIFSQPRSTRGSIYATGGLGAALRQWWWRDRRRSRWGLPDRSGNPSRLGPGWRRRGCGSGWSPHPPRGWTGSSSGGPLLDMQPSRAHSRQLPSRWRQPWGAGPFR